MGIPITAGFLKERCRSMADLNREKLQQIEECTFHYDGSMPESCVNAMYKAKVQQDAEVLEYLAQFPDDLVMNDGYGYNKEYARYLEIVNQ